jgi:hypothetical protein
MRIGQRAKKKVHRRPLAVLMPQIIENEMAVGHQKIFARRDYVDAISLHLYRLRDLNNAHWGHVLQQSR